MSDNTNLTDLTKATGKADREFNHLESKSHATESLSDAFTFANKYAGADLSAKVDAALADLVGGRGWVAIGPPADGSSWNWDTDRTYNPTNFESVFIWTAPGVDIDYTGGSVPLTFDSGGDTTGQGGTNARYTRVIGGNWIANAANNPGACFLLRDIFNAEIYPQMVANFTATGSAAGVKVENDSAWSENNTIGGYYTNCDINVDFAPASVTGGTGSESFVNTRLDAPHGWDVQNIGYRLQGDLRGSVFNRPFVNVGADGVWGYAFGGNLSNTTFISPRVVDANNSQINCVGVKTTANYGGAAAPTVDPTVWENAPTILAGLLTDEIDTAVDKQSNGHVVPVQNGGGVYEAGDGTALEQRWPPQHLTGANVVTELDTTAPAGSYTTITLSGPPATARGAILRADGAGDGTAQYGRFRLRENGSGRIGAEIRGWAGHSANTITHAPIYVPVDGSNQIEYETTNLTSLTIETYGYW